MNRLFITLYTAVITAILIAAAAATGILWLQWQPDHNYQLRRFTQATLVQIRDNLKNDYSIKPSKNKDLIQLNDAYGKQLFYTSFEVKRLRKLTAELGGLLALIYIDDLSLSDQEHQRLSRDEVIFRVSGHQRLSYLRYDQERVLEVELPTLKGGGNQWMNELIFLVNHQGGTLEQKLERARPVLFDTEMPQIRSIKESKLTRIELSRLLIIPRASMSLISTKHQVRFLHFPNAQPINLNPSDTQLSEIRSQQSFSDPQLIELNIVLSATSFPPIIIIPLLIIFVGFALWIKLNPIARQACLLAQVAQDFGEGDLSARVGLNGNGPIEKLALSFDQAANHIQRLILSQEGLLEAISHELRTPIARLYFLVDMLREDLEPEEHEQLLRDVNTNLEELTSLTDELVKYKRYRQGELTLSRAPCHISSFVRELLRQSFEISSTILFKDHTEKHLQVFVEEKALTRAINNVIQNATRYAKSHVEVSLHHVKGTVENLGEGEWVELWIEDDGIGIPIEFREKVFEPFVRVDQSRNRESGGVGLGLAITKTVIKALEGEVFIEDSTLGGTRLKILLPAQSHSIDA